MKRAIARLAKVWRTATGTETTEVQELGSTQLAAAKGGQDSVPGGRRYPRGPTAF